MSKPSQNERFLKLLSQIKGLSKNNSHDMDKYKGFVKWTCIK